MGGWSKGKGGGYSKGKSRDAASGKGKSGGSGGGGGRDEKPTDSPNFVVWSKGMKLDGSKLGVSYIVEDYVASGTFSRVFKVHRAAASSSSAEAGQKRRWAKGTQDGDGAVSEVLAAKVMRKHDSYIQYTSDACKEGDLLQKVEKSQIDAGKDVITMRCLDSFATHDDSGTEYWCLILEWLDASIFDLVRMNGNTGLHLSMVRIMLGQLFEQLSVLQQQEITHTDIKHRNCCLAGGEYFMLEDGGKRPKIILSNPVAKFIDYGNAIFEGDKKTHPIHTKQFRAPEVLLNVAAGWGPPSDTWTVGVTAAFMVSGQLIFNSHDPGELIRAQVSALGPFPESLLSSAKDGRARRIAEGASQSAGKPALRSLLGLAGYPESTPEARCADLILRMLAPDPSQRISAKEALEHPFLESAEPAIPPCPAGGNMQALCDRELGQRKGKSK